MSGFDWQRRFDDMEPDEHFEVVMQTIVAAISSGLTELGYEPHKFVLMLDAPNEGDPGTVRAADASVGFPDKAALFAFVMEHATELAGDLGIRMIARQASGPFTQGQG